VLVIETSSTGAILLVWQVDRAVNACGKLVNVRDAIVDSKRRFDQYVANGNNQVSTSANDSLLYPGTSATSFSPLTLSLSSPYLPAASRNYINGLALSTVQLYQSSHLISFDPTG